MISRERSEPAIIAFKEMPLSRCSLGGAYPNSINWLTMTGPPPPTRLFFIKC